MFFTSKEKSAIVKVSNMMILADGKVDPKELLFSMEIRQKLNIENADIKHSELLSNTEALDIISHMTDNQKRLVCALLGCMMAIDGNIDEAEHALWSLVSTLCNLPTMTLGEAIKEMKELA